MTTPVGALTFKDIADRVKRVFGDEAGAQITDLDIARWVDDAQREIALRNNLLQAKATTPTLQGDSNYLLPNNLLTLHSVKYKGQNLKASSLEQVDHFSLSNSAQGTPSLYYIWDKTINLYPVPETAEDNALTIYFTRQPVPITRDASGNPLATFVSELPTQYHNRIVEYCLAQAKELDDDSQGSQQKMMQFISGLDTLKDNSERDTTEAYPTITYVEDM